MEHRVAVDTIVGVIRGRSAIYLDEIQFSKLGSVTLKGHLSGRCCSRPINAADWIPYRLTFRPQIWMQTSIDLHEEDGYASSVDEVVESRWIEEIRSRRAGHYVTPAYKHYVVSTYDDIFDFVAEGFTLELGAADS
jgi:hypothetical protein